MDQNRIYDQEDVLRYTGVAGNDQLDPWKPDVRNVGDLKVDYSVGAGLRFPTVQAAIDFAVQTGATRRVVIGICAGHYPGLVYVPKTSFPMTLVGVGAGPKDTVLEACIDAEMPAKEYDARFAAHFAGSPTSVSSIFKRIAGRDTIGTANASVVRIESDDFELLNLTVRNAYKADREHPESKEMNDSGQFTKGQHQAVAVLVAGADRVHLQDLILRSFQDTLYLKSPEKGVTVRTNVVHCEIEGDVDFIFGQSTAWFEGCTIRSLGTRAAQSWAIAPSTDIRTRFGFVFHDCDFVHDGSAIARAGDMRLGRQWFEGVRATPFGQPDIADYSCKLGATSSFDSPNGTISIATLNSVGKCVIQNSRIGSHINKTMPWDNWGGDTWNPRHRPVIYTAVDQFKILGTWLGKQNVSYEDIDPQMVFLELLFNSDF